MLTSHTTRSLVASRVKPEEQRGFAVCPRKSNTAQLVERIGTRLAQRIRRICRSRSLIHARKRTANNEQVSAAGMDK